MVCNMADIGMRVRARTLRTAAAITIGLASMTAWGCAQPITRWMVELRTSQGDQAMKRPNLADAEKEYKLALALDPHNAHARAGLAKVLYLKANEYFRASKLDEADIEIKRSLRLVPSDAGTQALAGRIEQAKIRREIVISNYPLYGSLRASLNPAFKVITATNLEIEKQIKLFASDYDTAHLTRAILESYDLQDEAHRMALRLIAYRSLVQSGGSKARAPIQSQTPSLLPVP
ncbi:MAG: hypothetical protein DLM53_12135 [Candidatus Eremiobacter antarcticus]|nr:MAG: hypothetical protein DLM53_12135 [Candidatus Eremiobacter sp. RRmetagenome_bin22]